MKLGDRVEDQVVNAVIERGRQIRRAPDVVRARLLARARASVVSGEAAPSFVLAPPLPRVRMGVRLAVAAIVLMAFGAGAAAALHARAVPSEEAAPVFVPSPASPAVLAPPPEIIIPPRHTASRPAHPHRLSSPQESYAAEVALLQRAQSEYAIRAFANALVLVSEHAHRFPNGRLAEEREALRVRSLAGSHRGDEARRALVTFERRFPRSVLLPRLQEVARIAED